VNMIAYSTATYVHNTAHSSRPTTRGSIADTQTHSLTEVITLTVHSIQHNVVYTGKHGSAPR